MVGKRFLHYEVLDKLGEGAGGAVYKAVDLRLDRIVAVKFLSPSKLNSEELRARFEHEARAISALNHPSIATLFDVGSQDSNLFLVLEYLPGGTLKSEVQRHLKLGHLLSMQKVLQYGGQIASGLLYAHNHGIVHRDIKTDNMMLTGEGTVKITDFGVAMLQGKSPFSPESGTVGTLAYMSPEQIQGGPFDQRTDIYSLGIVFFELLTGRLPFVGEHEAGLVYAIVNDQPPPVSTLRPDVSEGLEEIIRRMLSKSVDARPHSIEELDQALNLSSVQGPLTIPRSSESGKELTSIAVLPFACLSLGTEDEYFAEGISEDLIHALGQIPTLFVPARTSSFAFRQEHDLRLIGSRLNVLHVVEGSFRRSGSNARITVRLVNANSGYQIWSSSYDRDIKDIVDVQNDITRTIAESLHVELARGQSDALLRARPANFDAFQLCMKGRYYWARRPTGIQNAIQYFKQAIEIDPGYPPALVGLADCYNTLGSWENGSEQPTVVMPLAMTLAEKALTIDDHLGEAHTSKAYCLFHYKRDWESAEREFRRAIQLSPDYSAVHHWYSHFLTAMGRTEESLRESRRALELDPLDMLMNVHLAWHFQLAEQFDEALEQAERSVRTEPGWHWSYFFLGWACEQKSNMTKAIDALSKSVELSSGHTVMTGALGHAYGINGERNKARSILRELEIVAKTKYVASYEIALIHFALGETDLGFDWLEKALVQRSGWLVYLNREPRLAAMRSDPRFQDMLRRIGFTVT
jgi:serine/threonine-protein kinase